MEPSFSGGYRILAAKASVSQPEYFVRDVMTSPVISIEPSMPLLDAALMLRGSAIRHLPVLEGGRLVGLLTDRDVQRCAPSRLIPITEDGYNAVFSETTVDRIMIRNPMTVSSTTPLLGAIALMQQARYGCFPVIDDGELIGILTRGDLIEALQQLLTKKHIGKDSLPSR
jgi:acetoin utilization protein AcuB